jgi:ribonuclease BN (tRNA processing enzyme)
MPHLIVFSHLRWDFVYQRPQHLLSRLAKHYPVIYIEEPLHDLGPARIETLSPAHGVEVLRPRLPMITAGV